MSPPRAFVWTWTSPVPTIDGVPTVDDCMVSYSARMGTRASSTVSPRFLASLAASKEKERHQEVLFPIRLDDTVLTTTQAWAAGIRRQRHIGDFTVWKDHDTYQQVFERLVRDLRTSTTNPKT